MPVIPGADLTSVSTKREPFPEGEYLVTVFESELAQGNKQLIIKTRIESPDEFNGREFWEFINLVQNDGKQNRMGLEQCKRYLEAAFGKGSAEAESNPPDTDPLNGHQVKLLLTVNEYWPKDEMAKPESERDPANKERNNKVKRIFPA